MGLGRKDYILGLIAKIRGLKLYETWLDSHMAST